MDAVFLCPSCNSPEQLSIVERVESLAHCEAITAKGPELTGQSEVVPERSETVGVSCSCGWLHLGADWKQQLRLKSLALG